MHSQLTQNRWKYTGQNITAFIIFGRAGLAWCYTANLSNGKTQIAGSLETLINRLNKLDRQEPTQ